MALGPGEVKVLQLHTSYRSTGGEDAVVDAEAELLRGAGHQVSSVRATNASGPLAAAAQLAQAPWNLAATRDVARVLRDEDPEVAHLHNTWFALSPAVIRVLARAGVPVVATLHNYRLACISADLFRDGSPCTDCVGRGPSPGVRHRCYRGSYAASAVAATTINVHRALRTWRRGVDRFVAPSAFAAELLGRAGVEPSRLTVKPHFTTDPGLRLTPCSASDEVLFVGRMAPGKGVEDLLRAWRILDPSGLRLTLVGDGPLRPRLEAEGPAGARFVGWRSGDEVRRLMLGARALVFPSTWYEPFGIVLIEALAAGLPVAGYDTAAVAAIVASERGGLLAPTGDVPGLTAGIDMLQDDALVDALGGASRSRFLAEYTPERNLPLLEAVYRGVR